MSIIVPVYNVEEYVRRCLESVLNQTYSYVEVIVIDDCSTDGSGKVIDEYIEKYDNIIVIHNEMNVGVSESRNKGIEIATGEYILFVDGDDYIPCNMIQEGMHVLEINRTTMKSIDTVCFGYDFVSDEGVKIRSIPPVLWPEMSFEKKAIFDKFIDVFFVSKYDLEYYISNNISYYDAVHRHKQMASVWRFLFSKDIIVRYKLSFNKTVERGEDLLFVVIYMQKCNGIVNCGTVSYQYVQRMTSVMHSKVDLRKKMSFMLAQDQCAVEARDGRIEELKQKWYGQRVLISMNLANSNSKELGFIKGFLEFRRLAGHRISKEAYKSISIKKARKKYFCAIGLLKCHCFFSFYFLIWILNKLHILKNEL